MRGMFAMRRAPLSPAWTSTRVRSRTVVSTPTPVQTKNEEEPLMPSTASFLPSTDDVARARQLLRWIWLEPTQREELQSFVDRPETSVAPSWFTSTYVTARQYRMARSRLWVPSMERVGGDLNAFLDGEFDAMRIKIERAQDPFLTLDAWDAMDLEEKADVVFQHVWRGMSEEERVAALTRVTFECARRLGWRSGFSSGFPGMPDDAVDPVQQVAKQLRSSGSSKSAVRRALQATEDQRAWDAWQALSPAERRAEWDTAWRQRDRSMIYVDDAPTTRLLGAPAPRWYAVPQRAGSLQFLPNVMVRLVRNYTPRGKPYDVWKATFRVPLNMHKHLLRSYLLAIYGLRTTWARSMVYRSKIVFSATKRRRVVGRGRTFKKVEVGLLEPFVFPSVSQAFLRTHLFSQEMLYEERRLMFKMTKGRRWRGHKSVRDLSRALDNNWAAQSAGAPDEEPVAKRPTAQLLVRKRSVPTARHSNILSVISERRAEREARVQKFLDEQRKNTSSSSS